MLSRRLKAKCLFLKITSLELQIISISNKSKPSSSSYLPNLSKDKIKAHYQMLEVFKYSANKNQQVLLLRQKEHPLQIEYLVELCNTQAKMIIKKKILNKKRFMISKKLWDRQEWRLQRIQWVHYCKICNL